MRSSIAGFTAGVTAAAARAGRVVVKQVAIDAFGNALGESLAASSGQGSGSSRQQGDPLGEFIERNMRAWQQRQANFDQIVNAFGQTQDGGRAPGVLVADAGDVLRLSSPSSTSDGAYYSNIIDALQARDAARQAASASFRAGEARATAAQYASGAGDLRETTAPAPSTLTAPSAPGIGDGYFDGNRDARLAPITVKAAPLSANLEPSMAEQALVTALHSASQAVAEIPLMVVDLAGAAVGAAYTTITGKAPDLTMYSAIGRAAENGIGTTELLQSLNPVYAGLVAQHDIRAGLARGDTRPLAAFSGSLLGGAVVGGGIARLPGYRPGPTITGATASRLRELGVPDWNFRLAPHTPGTLSANPLPFELERIGSAPLYKTWNQFQASTPGQFANRTDAARAWDIYKEANGISGPPTRSQAEKAKFLRELGNGGKAPRWMNQWLEKGRVPPGHEVDHIKPLSIGGADKPFNMRLLDGDLHDIHHRYYRPWELE
jgi:hypothetical protein